MRSAILISAAPTCLACSGASQARNSDVGEAALMLILTSSSSSVTFMSISSRGTSDHLRGEAYPAAAVRIALNHLSPSNIALDASVIGGPAKNQVSRLTISAGALTRNVPSLRAPATS